VWGAVGSGKWAAFEEGGDRAIMGGKVEFSLLCLLFLIVGGGKLFRWSCCRVCRCSIYIIIAVENIGIAAPANTFPRKK
jgi:hypothetical protein